MSHLLCQQSLLPVPGSMPKHIFNKNSITLGSVLDKHMGDCPNDFSILYNGASAHECVKERTTFFLFLFHHRSSILYA